MTDDPKRKRVLRVAAIVGVLLGLVCQFVPPEYRAICSSAAKVTGLFLGGCS